MINTNDLETFVKNNLSLLAVTTMLVVGLGLGASQFGIPGLTASITGSSLCGVSADDVRISSNDADVGGQTWIIEAVGGCSDHVIEGGAYVNPENVEARDPETGDTATAEKRFEIGFLDYESFAYYDIIDPNELSTYTVGYNDDLDGTGVFGGVVEEQVEECREWQNDNDVADPKLDKPDIKSGDTQYDSHVDDFVSSGKLHCFRAEAPQGNVGEFTTQENAAFTGEFKMEAGGDEASKEVNREQANGGVTLNANGRTAHIQYKGMLLDSILSTGFDSNLWRPVCDSDCDNTDRSPSYSIANQGEVDRYLNNKRVFEGIAEDAIARGDAQSASESFNNDVDLIYNDQSWRIPNKIGDSVTEVKFDGNKFKLIGDPDDPLFRPSFIFKVDSDWIGFNVPVAKPEIDSASDVSFTAKESATSRITVTNTGDVQGKVQTSVSCPSPLQAGYETKYIEAGQSETFNIDISSGPSPEKVYSCDVSVKDQDALGVPDRTSIDVDVASSCIDSDGDGTCDENDECIDEKGPDTNNGCPISGDDDTDNDGIPDEKDKCASRSETPQALLDKYGDSQEVYNGFEDSDGCPDEVPDPKTERKCSDGIDNDGDGLVDGADPDCDSGSETPWSLIFGALGGLGFLITLFYYRKPLLRGVRNFGA